MKYKEKTNKNYILLFCSVLSVFIILNFVNNNSICIDFNSNIEKAAGNMLLEKNDQYYLSYTYIKENIDEEIYFDNISKKIVISSDAGLFKLKVNEKKINVDFEEMNIKHKAVIEKEDKYISLDIIEKAYSIYNSFCNDTLYLYNNTNLDANLKYNNVSVYKENNLKSRVVKYVDKNSKIKVIFEKEDFVFVKINDKEVGYILKNAVKYNINKQEEKTENSDKSIYFFADKNAKLLNLDLSVEGIFIDMFSITRLSTDIDEKSVNTKFLDNIKGANIKAYGIINNGYDLSSFSTTTTSQILSDESKRSNAINNVNEKIKKYNLDGIVLDFRKLKEKDIGNYIQFIKELKAFTKKDVILNINANEYKQYIPVIDYTDFSVLNVYGQRDLKSTVSGSVSEFKWMEEIINNCLNKAHDEKIVIGVPAYSILWTEKKSNVVNSEIYNLKAMEDYIDKNKVEVKSTNGQNYIEIKKGTLIYRMWLEDEFSINNRLNIIREKNTKGIAIYKLGYENDTLINVLKNNY